MTRNRYHCAVSVGWVLSLMLGVSTVSGQTPSRENAPVGDTANAREPVGQGASKAAVEILTLPRDAVATRAASSASQSRPSNAKAAGSTIKRMFNELRPRTCQSQSPRPPNTSWPARGEAAIAFCQP